MSRQLDRITYDDVAPLDWFQLRAFLWEALSLVDRAGEGRWEKVAARVNAVCRASAPHPPMAYRDLFERIAATALPAAAVGSRSGLGHRLWNAILYEQAQRLFRGPPFMNLGYAAPGAPPGADEACRLRPEDEPFRLPIQLYHH